MRARSGAFLGALIGGGFGLWNLIATRMDPLSEDTPVALLIFYGPMFILWGVAGFSASRRSHRVLDGLRAGATLSFFTFVVYVITQFVRVNLFLETISRRSDWQNLMATFQTSGYESLRLYVNVLGLAGAPFKILVATMIGALTGFIGGVFGSASWHAFARPNGAP